MLKIIISKNWAEKPFPLRMSKKSFYTGSIHFRQFQATLVFVAEKPPPMDEGNLFYTGSIHFRQFWATLVFVAEKPPPQDEGNCFTLDLSIFRQFWATLVFVDEMSPPFSAFLWQTWLMSHMWNTHGLHTTNLHSDSFYPNIFFRLPTLSTFPNTHIYRSTGHRIVVQLAGL